MNKALVIYHRIDHDGLCSYEIAKQALSKSFQVDYLGWNYGDDIPNFDVLLEKYNSIVMVDISFPPEIMQRLKNTYKVTWIDHHETSLKSAEEFGYTDMPGLRDIGEGACKLCWKYFNPKQEVPMAVELFSQYDVHEVDGMFDWDEVVIPFQFATKISLGTLNINWDMYWEDIINDFEGDDDDIINLFIENAVKTGNGICGYLKPTYDKWVKSYGFEVTVAGKYNAICLLSPEFGSMIFESILKDYDLCIVANRKGPDQFIVSMYKEPEKATEFSCGQYMKENYQGGGHAGAAGGKLTLEQFNRLIVNCEI